jgi:hypothetical protein
MAAALFGTQPPFARPIVSKSEAKIGHSKMHFIAAHHAKNAIHSSAA